MEQHIACWEALAGLHTGIVNFAKYSALWGLRAKCTGSLSLISAGSKFKNFPLHSYIMLEKGTWKILKEKNKPRILKNWHLLYFSTASFSCLSRNLPQQESTERKVIKKCCLHFLWWWRGLFSDHLYTYRKAFRLYLLFQIFALCELGGMAGLAFRTAAEALTNDTKACLALCAVKQVAHPVALAIESTLKFFTVVST